MIGIAVEFACERKMQMLVMIPLTCPAEAVVHEAVPLSQEPLPRS